MIDSFDSRALRFTDCYGQRFMRAGVYNYNVLPAHAQCVDDERPFTIRVAERSTSGKMGQQYVVVRAKGSKFDAEPAEISIEAGDIVVWNCPDARAIPYTVIGDKEFFASHRLLNESGYTHAFGSAGEYEWGDAHGSRAGGVVRVKDPGCACDEDVMRWRKELAKGTLVVVSNASATPREVDIVVGQTVFFAVVKGPGISITDRRLLSGTQQRSEAKPERLVASNPGIKTRRRKK